MNLGKLDAPLTLHTVQDRTEWLECLKAAAHALAGNPLPDIVAWADAFYRAVVDRTSRPEPPPEPPSLGTPGDGRGP